ncbi:MAG: ACP S-malonyltransferase [Saprospiraceae bacterium]
MKAYVFPGQGAQFPGMAKNLADNDIAREYFSIAHRILGFDILSVMVDGSEADLKQTRITQPAIFLHSVIASKIAEHFSPQVVAGHSLGEFSALVASGAMLFEEGLSLVLTRAVAMQKACDLTPGTMAAIIGMEDSVVENVCADIDGIVVPANYNCPGQLVISGEVAAVEAAMEKLKELGCRNAIKLPVGGAFHSPLMALAEAELKAGIERANIQVPSCPIYQNIDAKPHSDPDEIRVNLLKQLTGPVKWSQTIQQMIADGVSEFIEVGGNGKVLSGLIKKVDRKMLVRNI